MGCRIFTDDAQADASGELQQQYQQQAFTSGSVASPPPRKVKVLDGFYLLQAGKVEFPEEVNRIVMQNKKLGAVAAEDLPYFTNLKSVAHGDWLTADVIDEPQSTACRARHACLLVRVSTEKHPRPFPARVATVGTADARCWSSTSSLSLIHI